MLMRCFRSSRGLWLTDWPRKLHSESICWGNKRTKRRKNQKKWKTVVWSTERKVKRRRNGWSIGGKLMWRRWRKGNFLMRGWLVLWSVVTWYHEWKNGIANVYSMLIDGPPKRVKEGIVHRQWMDAGRSKFHDKYLPTHAMILWWIGFYGRL